VGFLLWVGGVLELMDRVGGGGGGGSYGGGGGGGGGWGGGLGYVCCWGVVGGFVTWICVVGLCVLGGVWWVWLGLCLGLLGFGGLGGGGGGGGLSSNFTLAYPFFSPISVFHSFSELSVQLNSPFCFLWTRVVLPTYFFLLYPYTPPSCGDFFVAPVSSFPPPSDFHRLCIPFCPPPLTKIFVHGLISFFCNPFLSTFEIPPPVIFKKSSVVPHVLKPVRFFIPM